jgi:Outer membrane cobalamin receptor protein
LASVDNRFYSIDSTPLGVAESSGADAGTATTTQIDGAATTTSGGTSLTGTDGIFTLDTLTVEADRPDWEKNLSPGTVSVVDVPQFSGEHKTFADMLETVPGVYIDRVSGGGTGHYSTARIRGSSASQVNIYIDGVLVNTGSEQAVNLENINMDNVQRIEVYRGYILARFAGAAMGGAINVVTKRPDKVGGKVTAGLRSFGGQKIGVETTAPLGKGSLMLAYNYDKADGDFTYYRVRENLEFSNPGDPPYPTKRTRQNNGYENNSLFAKWQDDNWFVKLDYRNNVADLPASVMEDFVDLPPDRQPNWISSSVLNALRNASIETEKLDFSVGRRQTHKNLEWGWKFAASHQDKSSLFTKSVTPGARYTGTNTFKNTTYEVSVDGSWRPSDRHLLEFLASTRRETMKVGFDQDDLWSTNRQDFGKYFIPRYELKDHYFQLQDTISLDSSGSLTYTPLVRAQKSEIGIDVQEGAGWLYSNSHALKKTYGNWTLRGTYGSYYKLPNWYEVFGDGVNLVSRWHYYRNTSGMSPDVFAEHGTNWDLSANWTGKVGKVDADITLGYFNRRSENLLVTQFNPLTGAAWYINYGEGKIEGIELSTKLRWNRFDLGFGTTWQDSVITKGHTKDVQFVNIGVEGRSFPWTPETQYNVRLDYRFPKDKLSVFGEYLWTGQLGYSNADVDETHYEAIGIFNVGMKYNFNSKFKMNLGINDIANKGPKQVVRNVKAGSSIRNIAYPQQGRTYYMTLEYGF